MVTPPNPPGSRQLISPPLAVFEIAPANVLHGAVRLHGLTSSPTPDTHVRVAWAEAEAGRASGIRASAGAKRAIRGKVLIGPRYVRIRVPAMMTSCAGQIAEADSAGAAVLGRPADLAGPPAARRLRADPAVCLGARPCEQPGDVDLRVLVRVAVAVGHAAVGAQLEREPPEGPVHVDVVEDGAAVRAAALEVDLRDLDVGPRRKEPKEPPLLRLADVLTRLRRPDRRRGVPGAPAELAGAAAMP